jgi:hypothetical protein
MIQHRREGGLQAQETLLLLGHMNRSLLAFIANVVTAEELPRLVGNAKRTAAGGAAEGHHDVLEYVWWKKVQGTGRIPQKHPKTLYKHGLLRK